MWTIHRNVMSADAAHTPPIIHMCTHAMATCVSIYWLYWHHSPLSTVCGWLNIEYPASTCEFCCTRQMHVLFLYMPLPWPHAWGLLWAWYMYKNCGIFFSAVHIALCNCTHCGCDCYHVYTQWVQPYNVIMYNPVDCENQREGSRFCVILPI